MNKKEQIRKESEFTLREVGLQRIAYEMGKKDAQKEFLDKINKKKWTLKDIDNNTIDEATYRCGNEVFMDMHNEDINDLIIELKRSLEVKE